MNSTVPCSSSSGSPAGCSPPRQADGKPHYEDLLAAARQYPAIAAGIVHPCSQEALEAALEAARLGLIKPRLIGPAQKIRDLASRLGLDLGDLPLIDVPHSHAAAACAVDLARSGQVEALVKGSLHSDELMTEVVSAAGGLRTKRRVSHVFVLDVPSYPRPLLISDAAVNIAPDLETKADIVRNAIDLAHALAIAEPRVAILSAIETVSPKLRSSLDAAALAKMADRGQITGAIVDGPLAFDNAVSLSAAAIKRLNSAVAGQADVLIVPDLEAGNMLVKQLEYLSGAQTAGIVLGARVPIALTSRADAARSRIASCAIALILAHRYRVSPP